MHSIVFRCLLAVLLFFVLALLHNHCYSLHKTNSSLVISGDLAGSWTSRNKNAVFSSKFKSAANLFSPNSRGKPPFLL